MVKFKKQAPTGYSIPLKNDIDKRKCDFELARNRLRPEFSNFQPCWNKFLKKISSRNGKARIRLGFECSSISSQNRSYGYASHILLSQDV